MSKPKKKVIEFRSYSLQPNFSILLLSGNEWHISDIPAKRLHFHNCLELGLCEEGTGTIEFVNNRKLAFQAGDTTLIASDVIHTTYSSPGTSSKWSYIFVDIEEFFYPYFSLYLLDHSEMIQQIIHSYSAILSRKNYPHIYQQMVHMIQTMKKKDQNYKFATFGTMMSFLIDIMNIFDTAKEDNIFNKETSDNALTIAPALEYIRKNYSQEFSMNYLANLCGMSSTHFRRTFASIMNTGALEYLIRLRIEKASLLLRTTDMPILNISEEVGFHSLSSFNRHFSSIVGIAPREWRKKMSVVNNLNILKNNGWMTPPTDTVN